MKKIALLFLLLQGCLFAAPNISSDLKEVLNVVYSCPESKKLLEEVEKEGQISIYSAPFNSNSNAKWLPDERSIILNAAKRRSFGEKVRSIVFELHNASTTKHFDELDWRAAKRQISKQDYVVTVERMEHKNALQTKQIIQKAIQAGLFPRDSFWNIPDDFNTHYQVQYSSGHSQAIGALYDQLQRGFVG